MRRHAPLKSVSGSLNHFLSNTSHPSIHPLKELSVQEAFLRRFLFISHIFFICLEPLLCNGILVARGEVFFCVLCIELVLLFVFVETNEQTIWNKYQLVTICSRSVAAPLVTCISTYQIKYIIMCLFNFSVKLILNLYMSKDIFILRLCVFERWQLKHSKPLSAVIFQQNFAPLWVQCLRAASLDHFS